MDFVYEYLLDAGGIEAETDYPYIAHHKHCRAKPGKFVASIASYELLEDVSETKLMQLVAQQPVTVALMANQFYFKYYKSGVMTGHCGDELDHAVLVVGYGTEDGVPYWKIKNSWGTEWGDEGYIKIERGTDKCGIRTYIAYPIVDNINS